MLLILAGVVFFPLIVAVGLRIRRLQHAGGNTEYQGAKGRPPSLRKVFRTVAHCAAVAGILLMLLLTPDNQYGWMCSEEEWGGPPPASCTVPDDSSGNSALFSGVVLTVVLAVQLALAACASNRKEMTLSAALIVLAVCAWGFA
jgi:hypothetical protein